MSTPFWFVWDDGGHAPRFKHPTPESAGAEAQRLARNHPGRTFIVLQSVVAFAVNDMQKTDLRPTIDDIPF